MNLEWKVFRSNGFVLQPCFMRIALHSGEIVVGMATADSSLDYGRDRRNFAVCACTYALSNRQTASSSNYGGTAYQVLQKPMFP